MLEQVLTVGGENQVGAGAVGRVKETGVEVALGHTILGLHEAVEINVATVNVPKEDYTTSRTNLYTPLIDLLLRLCRSCTILCSCSWRRRRRKLSGCNPDCLYLSKDPRLFIDS